MGRRKVRTTKRWQPKTWKSVYDRVIGYAVLDKSNDEIAEILGKTKQWVSNILTCDEGIRLYNELALKVKEKTNKDVIDHMKEIEERSIRNVHKVLTDDALLEQYPFKMAQLSMDVAKGVGKLKDATGTNVQNNFFGVPADLQNQLLEGLEVANIAKQRQLNSGRDLNDIKPASNS